MLDVRNRIAKNIAMMFHDGDFVNLGVGIPTLVSKYIPEDQTILLHGENGCIGLGKIVGHCMDNNHTWEREHSGELSTYREGHKDLGNAGGEYVTLIPGGSCFDSLMAFGMARGGHLDATVLGALQVDQEGNLANWAVPGKSINGIGGAMDIVSGAKKVIIAMEHCSKNGSVKIVKQCSMPLTAKKCVDVIVTDLCVMKFIEGKLTVTAVAPCVSKKEIVEKTEAEICFAEELQEMLVD